MRWDNDSDMELVSAQSAETSAAFSARCPNSRIQSGIADANVMALLQDFMSDEEWLSQGQLVSRIMRCPSAIATAFLEYLNGSGAYASLAPSVVCKLQNISDQPVDVQVSSRPRFYRESGGIGATDGAHEIDAVIRTVQPLEYIELGPMWTVLQLMKYDRTAMLASRWRHNWLFPTAQGDMLRECGFISTYTDSRTGELVSVMSNDYDGSPKPFASEGMFEPVDPSVAQGKAAAARVGRAKARKAAGQ